MAQHGGGGGGSFSEVAALIQRNEQAARNAGDVEQDLRRVLLMARDAKLRDQMVQFQAVRRIATIWTNTNEAMTQRYCAGILGNLAQSERGRLSASSCDRWGCVSHRHRCPLFLLLSTAQCSPDAELQHVSAAALLAFSIQNECQLQIDAISGIPTLLRLLDSRDADLCVFAAATMWNIYKSPLLMLKLETTHGILKDQLARRLTDFLAIPLEPFELAARPTGERSTAGIIESDSPENLNLLVSCSINTQLRVVLRVENYTGHTRSLTDQFRSLGSRAKLKAQQGVSVAHFDESGVLAARSCCVCTKSIRVTRKSARGTFLLCAREDCEQTYHIKCSRWARLDKDDVHPEHFHCDRCMLLLPLYYWDFVTEDAQHAELLSENLFRSVAITRVQPVDATSNSGGNSSGGGAGERSAYAMLFNRKQELLGVGVKRFRIPRSSKDDETFVVLVQFVATSVYPATRQASLGSRPTTTAPVAPAVRQANTPDAGVSNDGDTEALDCDWEVSYAREDASGVAFKPGNILFWPASFLLDVAPLRYTDRSLRELESVWVYEFQGEQPTDRMYSFGASRGSESMTTTTVTAATASSDALRGLWTSLYPRKGVCMKVLAEQVGRVKQLSDACDSTPDVASVATAKPASASGKSRSRRPKPHFPGKKLNRVAVATE